MRTRPLSPMLIAVAALAVAAPGAHAAFFPGEILDSSPGVAAVEAADVAPDGSGAIAYRRSEGGVEHLFVARLVNGAFQPVERVDGGVREAASSAQIVASDGGRLIAAWSAGGRLLVSARGASEAAWPAPVTVYDGRASGRTVTNVSLDASIFGVPYLAFTTTGSGGADVRAARVVGGRWTVEPALLDVNPGANAGEGAVKGPDISVSADGTSLAVWGEDGADGRVHVYARRVTRRGVATTVREVSVPTLNGRRSLGAGSPEAALEYDSSYAWVVFRQTFDEGSATARVIARRLVGSDFDPPVAVDGLGLPAAEGAGTPHLDVDGRGRGLATSVREGSFQTVGSVLRNDVFQAPARLDTLPNSGPSFAVPAAAENGRVVVAWQRTPAAGRPAEIRARRLDVDGPEPEAVVSRPELGAAVASRGLAAAADRLGDTVVAFVQGPAGARKLVAAVDDRPPGGPVVVNRSGWQRNPRPKIKWTPSTDLWGSPTYRFFFAGFEFARGSSAFFRPPANLPDGVYPYHVEAVDRRGQTRVGRERNLRVDATLPLVLAPPAPVVAGERAVLALLDVGVVRPGAFPPPGSGIALARIDFGDDSAPVIKRRRSGPVSLNVPHVYQRSGRYTIRVKVADRAGNSARARIVVKVARAQGAPAP